MKKKCIKKIVLFLCCSTYAAKAEEREIFFNQEKVLVCLNEPFTDLHFANQQAGIRIIQFKEQKNRFLISSVKKQNTNLFLETKKGVFSLKAKYKKNAPSKQNIFLGKAHTEKESVLNEDEICKKSSKQVYFSFGEIKYGITFLVTDIFHYKKNTILKITFHNKSFIPFDVAELSINQIISESRLFFFKKIKQRKKLNIVFLKGEKLCPPKTVSEIFVCIPTIIGDEIEVIIQEDLEQGIRSFKTTIPNNVFFNAKRVA